MHERFASMRRGRSPSGNFDLRGFEDPDENFVELVNSVPHPGRFGEYS